MATSGVYNALNQLVTVLYRSLPSYLAYASPWTHHGDEKAVAALRHIDNDQKRLAKRIADHIIEHYGPVELGEYPLDFPDTHDLSLDFLLRKLVLCQKSDIATIEQLTAALTPDRKAVSVAEEALGSARGHLETLEELAAEAAKHPGWAR
jgi:hypothetical protein